MPSNAVFEGTDINAYDFTEQPDAWLEIQRKVRTAGRRYPLRCVVCDSPMYCRRLPLPYLTPLFAHCPGYGHGCVLAAQEGESPEHYALKGQIHKTISATKGWLSKTEVALGNRRPDIVATRIDGVDDCCVFEVQLSPISLAEVTTRQRDHTPHCRQSSWVVRDLPAWMYDVPAYQTTEIDGTEVVTKGLVAWEGGLDGSYVDAKVPLSNVTRMILKNRIAHHAALGWVSLNDADKAAKAAQRKAQDSKRRRVPEPPQWKECDRPVVAASRTWSASCADSFDNVEYRIAMARAATPVGKCVVCGKDVVVTASGSYQLPLHHRCARRLHPQRHA